jgi:FtsP/CotA-like multicopper oxidase with cupredoxin domain
MTRIQEMVKVTFILMLCTISVSTHAQLMHDMKNMRNTASHDTIVSSSGMTGKYKTVVYHLNVTDTMVNYTGKSKHAIAINGTIPAPTLYFTEGDTAEIYVHNSLREETIIHWHGVILPNQYDGVAFLTTQPIKAGQTHLFKFPVVQTGTYWYHSHAKWQEQSGMYGALIFRKKEEVQEKEYTLVLSDWIDEKPSQVDRRLHSATDWYAIKKGSTQNYGLAIKEGFFKTKLTNEWKRMVPMDVSDVAYDRVLLNGQVENQGPPLKAGDKIKLHIVNGSASSYFWLQFAGTKITIVASDGADVVPVEVDRMIIAVAETYDIEVTVPGDMSYEFKATTEDRTKATSLWLGSGMKMPAPVLPPLNYFKGMEIMNSMMKMDGTMDNMGMQMHDQIMDMNSVMYSELNQSDSARKKSEDSMPGMDMSSIGSKKNITLKYTMLKAATPTILPNDPVKLLHFNLTGNMNRYVWSINNKTVSESDKILIKKGENVRIILYNGTMMRHPMHLHGHFFRVLNGQGDYSPLKNTLDIMPMETDTIEFAATESGDWFFHCHILYHMMSGMGRIFSYENSPPNPEVPDPDMALKMVNMDDRMIHPAAQAAFQSNGTDGQISFSTTRYRFQTEWKVGFNNQAGYESQGQFGRYLGQMQYWFSYVGWDFQYHASETSEKNTFGQVNSSNNRNVAVVGVQYLLPMLVIADARVDMDGNFRLQLSRQDIAFTSRLRFGFKVNTDREYMFGLRYIITKTFSISTQYDSDLKFGAGIALTY